MNPDIPAFENLAFNQVNLETVIVLFEVQSKKILMTLKIFFRM